MAEDKIREQLLRMHVEYELLDCDPKLADTEVFCRHYGYSLAHSANTLIIAGKANPRRHVACVLLANTRVDVNRVVRKRLGVRRASFADGEETRSLTGMELGGVTPLCLPEEMPIWVDSRIAKCDYIILGGGSRSLKLKISPLVFDQMTQAEYVEKLAKPADS